MPKLTLNGQEVEFLSGMTILQVAEQAGVEVPIFCYHPKLTIAGNCRMCLVEVEKSPKPVASCSMPAAEGMVVKTNTPYVEKARKGVLEFLLINHPLDCPICDQGGECDLQDITMNYGASRGRYHENKRAVTDKNFGPLIKTIMTRCIHCTRCVRFATEIAGVQELGATGRGEHMEIGTYVEKTLSSELSGNMVDICPVGALTSKPYAFHGRPWELTKTNSIDVLDAVGSNIRVDSRGLEVMRILPRANDEVNEDWLADKARFSYDGLKRQRLDRPYVRNEKGQLVESSWDEAFLGISRKLRACDPKKVAAIAGDLVDVESMFALKMLLDNLNIANRDCRQDGADYTVGCVGDYTFNTTIAGLEEADACLIIGAQPRFEAPLVNARLRKRYFNSGLSAAYVGAAHEPTFPMAWLGDSPQIMLHILEGKHPFSQTLKEAKNPALILGAGALARTDGSAIHDWARMIARDFNLVRPDWNGFNVLHTAAARMGGLMMSFLPKAKGMGTRDIIQASEAGDLDFLYLLGADEVPEKAMEKPFVVYQGHHGDQAAMHADVILPGAAYTEKDATYVNMEGRVQRAYRAVFAPHEAREDWKIIRALSDYVAGGLTFIDRDELRSILSVSYPKFSIIDQAQPGGISEPPAKAVRLEKTPFSPTVTNYYMTDAISRHSPTMAQCTHEAHVRHGKNQERGHSQGSVSHG